MRLSGEQAIECNLFEYFQYSNITFLNIVDETKIQNNGTLGGKQ
jgi:hypothetical protein